MIYSHEKAKEKQADIWPVAFSKEAREPVDNISKKQSYDIWEQLRCRGLDKIHISAIAKAFSRKIIARELPTLYNNCGEVFISHRRIDGEEIAALIYDKIKIQFICICCLNRINKMLKICFLSLCCLINWFVRLAFFLTKRNRTAILYI